MSDQTVTFTDQVRHRVIAAAATPMTRDGHVDPAVVADYGRGLAEAGVGGIAVWAHTGRGLHLPERTSDTVLAAFRSATGLPLIAGAGVPAAEPATSFPAQVAATVRMAQRAEALGADSVLVYPCRALRDAPDGARASVALHDAVAGAVDVPLLGFYLYPEAGGFPYSAEALPDILALPQVAGMKIATLDSAMTCQDVIASVRATERLAVTGEDRMFGASLMWGSQAALVGIAAAAAPLSVAVVDTWFAGDAAGFLTASARLDEFAAATFRAPMDGYIQRMLWAAAAEQLIPDEHAHDPYGPPLPPEERHRVGSVLERLPAG